MTRRTLRPLIVLLLSALAAPRLAQSEAPPAEPLTLRRAVELAMAHAPDVAVAQAARAGAEADARLARDAFHTGAEISTTPGYARGLPVAVLGRVPAVAGVTGHRLLYDPAQRHEALSAEAGAAEGRARAEAARREAARAAAAAYARCWADQARTEAARRGEEALGRSLARIQALEKEGRVTGLAVEAVRLRAERARLARIGAESEGELDRLDLARLIGEPVGAVAPADPAAELPSPPAAGSDAIGSSPIGSRPIGSRPIGSRPIGSNTAEDVQVARAADPELRADQEALGLLGQSMGLRRRLLAPTVDAVAQYYRLDPHFERFFRRFREDTWSVALSVALPLWTGGRAADGLARAQANLDQKTAESKARESEVDLAVRKAAAARDHAQAAAALARQAVALAEEDLRVTRALAGEGRVGDDEVDAKESALASALGDAAQADRDLLTARIDLLALRGELVAVYSR